jgi:hypothetical protein
MMFSPVAVRNQPSLLKAVLQFAVVLSFFSAYLLAIDLIDVPAVFLTVFYKVFSAFRFIWKSISFFYFGIGKASNFGNDLPAPFRLLIGIFSGPFSPFSGYLYAGELFVQVGTRALKRLTVFSLVFLTLLAPEFTHFLTVATNLASFGIAISFVFSVVLQYGREHSIMLVKVIARSLFRGLNPDHFRFVLEAMDLTIDHLKMIHRFVYRKDDVVYVLIDGLPRRFTRASLHARVDLVAAISHRLARNTWTDLFVRVLRFVMFAFVMTGLGVLGLLVSVGVFLGHSVVKAVAATFIALGVAVVSPDHLIDFIVDGPLYLLHLAVAFLPFGLPDVRNAIAIAAAFLDDKRRKRLPHESGRSKEFRAFRRKTLASLRLSIVRFVSTLDSYRLPEGIRAEYQAPSVSTISASFDAMAEAGWPVDPNFRVTAPIAAQSFGSKLWNSWQFASSNFVVPLRRLMAATVFEMSDFGFADPGYIHTATYTSEMAEMNSISRYFIIPPDVTLPENLDEDLWHLVKSQFAYSVLTDPVQIIRSWVKKYNLGIGYTKSTKNGFVRQMKRSQAIASVGGLRAFTDLWNRTLKFAGTLTSLAPVFTKFETLKPAKALAGLVRTVVGSALPHHVFTTLWNHAPNHNFKPWETPMKVGMSLNGTEFGKLWATLGKRKNVFAGDMKDFDSTVPPEIVRLCASIRKRGYEWHSNYVEIANMIDVAYEQLITQPLAIRSTGGIFASARGFTTGHSSTSADNSLALVACYLYAWRKATGRTAREFVQHNTLANFGDDHLLAYDDYPGWNPKVMAHWIAELGITLKNEHPECPLTGLEGKSFLAKYPIFSSSERSRVIRAGVLQPPAVLTAHSRTRLIGKIKGQTLQKDRLVRYQRLISYMKLSAHQEDIYKALVKAATRLHDRHGDRWRAEKRFVPNIPSYDTVLYDWYKTTDSIDEPDTPLLEPDFDEVFVYIGPSFWDTFNYILSFAPEIASPRFANSSWVRYVHKLGAKQFAWPTHLLKMMNPDASSLRGLTRVVDRCAYEFLTPEALDLEPRRFSKLDLLVRHWVFVAIRIVFIGKYRAPGVWRLIETFDRSLAELYFAYSGVVLSGAVTLDFHFTSNLLVFILGSLPPLFPDFEIGPPTPEFFGVGHLIASSIQRFWDLLQPSARVNFDLARVAICAHRHGSLFVKAPTGVGKSTRLIGKIAEWTGRPVVVLEPRHVLVTGLVPYVSDLLAPTIVGGSTTGMSVPKGATIIYGTPQSLLMQPKYLNRAYVWVVDEAHIDEPMYLMAQRVLERLDIPMIKLSATPPASVDTIVELEVATSYSVERVDLRLTTMNAYRTWIIDRTSSHVTGLRWLIFVPTLAMADELAPRLPGKVAFLNSKEAHVPDDAVFILSTRVADAGLTLPDVNVVITSDVDVTVTTDRKGDGDQFATVTRSIFHRVSDSTLLQRVGRTGRTSHGTAYVMHLERLTAHREIDDYNPTAYDHLLQTVEAVERFPEMVADLDPAARRLYEAMADDPKVTIARNEISTLIGARATYDDVLVKEFGPGIALTDRPLRG